jgi:putative chitinase
MRISEILNEVDRRGFLKKLAGGAAAGAAAVGALKAPWEKFFKGDEVSDDYGKEAEPVNIPRQAMLINLARRQMENLRSMNIINSATLQQYSERALIRALLSAKPYASNQEIAQFLAQCKGETGAFTSLDERLEWKTPERMFRHFTKKLNPNIKNVDNISPEERQIGMEKAQELISNPEDFKSPYLANFIYANVIGNGPEDTGDGWNYRGKGFLHLTGKANYRDIGGESLVANPDLLLTDMNWAIFTAVNYWLKRVASKSNDWADTAKITKLVNPNTGADAISKRDRYFKEYMKIIGSVADEIRKELHIRQPHLPKNRPHPSTERPTLKTPPKTKTKKPAIKKPTRK